MPTSMVLTGRDIGEAQPDKFQALAPHVIRAGQAIDVWALTRDTRPQCEDLEGALNQQYQTLVYGWATRVC